MSTRDAVLGGGLSQARAATSKPPMVGSTHRRNPGIGKTRGKGAPCPQNQQRATVLGSTGKMGDPGGSPMHLSQRSA